MARKYDPHRLSRPTDALQRMIIFLVVVGLLLVVLYRQVIDAFQGNLYLNSLIIFVLFVGIALAFRSVIRLFREVRWVNSFREGDSDYEGAPTMLAPMAAMLRDQAGTTIGTATMRSILESIATRLDENRETLRYLTGLLVFLGLLGTFWGLLGTVRSVGDTIQSLNVGSGDTNLVFEDLKAGLAAPLSSMSIAFSSSLFGLAASLVLGFLDLQAGQAQNLFYTQLENWLSTVTDIESFDIALEDEAEGASTREQDLLTTLERLSRSLEQGGSSRGATTAMANLAEGIQGLVQHMRSEQQLMRDWVEGQASQQEAIHNVLERLSRVEARRSGTSDKDPNAYIKER